MNTAAVTRIEDTILQATKHSLAELKLGKKTNKVTKRTKKNASMDVTQLMDLLDTNRNHDEVDHAEALAAPAEKKKKATAKRVVKKQIVKKISVPKEREVSKVEEPKVPIVEVVAPVVSDSKPKRQEFVEIHPSKPVKLQTMVETEQDVPDAIKQNQLDFGEAQVTQKVETPITNVLTPVVNPFAEIKRKPVDTKPTIPNETIQAIEGARKISVPSDVPAESSKSPRSVSTDQWKNMLDAVQQEKALSEKKRQVVRVDRHEIARPLKHSGHKLFTALAVLVLSIVFLSLLYAIDQGADKWAAKEGEIVPAAGINEAIVVTKPIEQAPPEYVPVVSPIVVEEPSEDGLLELLQTPN